MKKPEGIWDLQHKNANKKNYGVFQLNTSSY